MNIPGVILLLALFISNALALYFLYNDKAKFSGVFNIASLCLTVALAYHFKQIKSIAIVIGVVLVVVVAVVLIRIIVRKKIKQKQIGAENEKNNSDNTGGKENENN